MKTTTTPMNITVTGPEPSLTTDRSIVPRIVDRLNSAEEEQPQVNQIFTEGNGRGLMKFCRELAVILVRQFSKGEEASDLRESLVPSLQTTLSCSAQQANCLIDLALEMIHAKVHGSYRRSGVELSYLIAMATGAVSDVTAN